MPIPPNRRSKGSPKRVDLSCDVQVPDRAKQLRERLPALTAEIEFALGRSKSMGILPTPPDWALTAVRLVCGEGGPLAFLGRLNKPGVKWTPEDLGLVKSFMDNTARLFEHGTPETTADETAHPENKHYRETIGRETKAVTEARIQATRPKKVDVLPKIETSTQHARFAKGYGAGATLLVDEKGAFIQTAQKFEVCLFLWFFWPEVVKMKNRAAIHDWLKKEFGYGCGFDNFESICGSIGLRPARRGRPVG